MFYGHPMSVSNQLGEHDQLGMYVQLGEHNQMGMTPYTSSEWEQEGYSGFFDDMLKSVEQSVLDPIKSGAEDLAKSVGLSDKDINKISGELDKEYKKKIEEEKQKAAQNLAREIIGVTEGKSKSPAQASTGGDVVQQITKQFEDLQKSDVVKAIPGGLYTILGVGAAGLVFLLWPRK